METEVFLHPSLAQTETESRIRALLRLYNEVDSSIAAWSRRTPIRCPAGCGACCEHFEPQVVSAEAELVAAFLLQNIPPSELVRSLVVEEAVSPAATSQEQGRRCPYYSSLPAGHCAIYPVRPLVCRVYGFSSSVNKRGERVFRPCAHMGFEHTLSEAGSESTLTAPPPEFSESGRELALLCSTDLLPLGEAVAAAWGKILLLISLAGAGRYGDSDRPPRVTGPKAA
jgi:Fe-S-cluster containining protein